MLFEQQLSRIEHRLVAVEQKEDIIMAAQDDINAAVTAISGFLSDLSTQVTAISALLAAGGGTPVTTAALNNVVAQIPAAQAAVDALANPQPAPPPVSASAASGAFRPAL
jgi:hypothetical protein